MPRLAENADLELMILNHLLACLTLPLAPAFSIYKLKHPILLRIGINQVAEEESFYGNLLYTNYYAIIVTLIFLSTSSSDFTFFLKLCDITK